jgi:GAF domain-containing protein
MNREAHLRDAVAAAVLAAEAQHRDLLASIVQVARAIFRARASSIFLFDESTDELVFEAVAGPGEDTLVGKRYPSSTGISGWVLVTRQPLVIEDVERDPRFARDVAEGTGFVPRGIMAAPLLLDERALGVLSVLDRPQRSRFSLEEVELLGLFANQAALALDLLRRTRQVQGVLDGAGGDVQAVARLARCVDGLPEGARADGVRLVEALASLLERS